MLNASLEQQVAAKAACLQQALHHAETTNAMISYMADHDPLTGLYNRRRMHNERLALIFMDMNHFKAVNDQYGHEAGDRLLTGFAESLERVTREGDVAGRWGGDEFIMLLPGATVAQTGQFADRLRQQLQSQPIAIGSQMVHASVSIGVAVFPEDGNGPATLLACADAQMYAIKRARSACTALP